MLQPTHTILCVDDEVGILKALKRLFRRAGYHVLTAGSGEIGLEILKAAPVDLIISDQRMYGMQGNEFLQLSQKIRPDAIRIMLTGYADIQAATASINYGGICKFILKPWDDAQLLETAKSELRQRDLERKLQEYERNKEYAMIFGLAKLAESKDPETGEHLFRVESYTRLLAKQLATLNKYEQDLTPDWVETLARSSVLHDIGKVGIPDSILLKPGRLDPEEWEVMQTHATIGGETLAASESVLNIGAETFLSVGREIAYHHHEWYDGSGYPFGLADQDIPLAARIVAVADGYDALRSKRPYKDALPHETVKEIILEDKGKHYHPDVVDAFLDREADFLAIRSASPD